MSNVANSAIVHFTTVHSRNDIRIWVKQIHTLADVLDRTVVLYVQDGQGNEGDDFGQTLIIDLGRPTKNRFVRMTVGAWRMGLAVLRAKPVVAHFHDPELIPVGLILRLAGINVIYDVHEDVPSQILSKHWLPAFICRPFAWALSLLEWLGGWALSSIVAATPKIAERFPNDKTVTVQNFPILSEFAVNNAIKYEKRPPYIAYVGEITKLRGVFEMIEVINLVSHDGICLQIAGNFQPAKLRKEVETLSGWNRVQYHGWLDRKSVAELLGQVRMGMVLFHPEPNHVNSQPNKLFEYLSAGIPVIVSKFPLWCEIVEDNQCGLTVDPLDTDAIAESVEYLLEHPREAKRMGENGNRAVELHYNWANESKKLIDLYRELIKT